MAARKLIVILFVALVLGAGSIWTIAQWLNDHGVIAAAEHVRHEYLTGTAITVIVALLILLPDRLNRRRSQGSDHWPFD